MSPFTSIVSSDVLCPSFYACCYFFMGLILIFFPSFRVMPFAFQLDEGTNLHFNHMASAFEICEEINLVSIISKKLVLKCHFFEINKEMENVNKGGRRVNKHDKRWAKNSFESSMGLTHSNPLLIFQKMNLFLKICWICCFFFFFLQVAKKDGCFYPPTKYVVFPFF